MSFKRSWSRRLAAILSAVMVVSTAAPISVPAMEAQADDILSAAVTQEDIAEADNAGSDAGNVTGESAALAEGNGASLVTDDEVLVTEDGAALTAGEDALLDAEDELAAELTNGAQADELAEGMELIDETDALIEEPETAEDETYTGKLRLNTVSAGLVKKIEYKFDNELSWNVVDITKDGLKASIPFTGAKYISFRLKDPISSSEKIWVSDGDEGYRVNFWVEGYPDKVEKITSSHESPWDTVSFSLKDYNFIQNGILDLNVSPQINKYNRKKGNLIIHVASENRIPGTDKVISINNVKVQLGYYAIEYDDSGNIVKAKYRDTQSVNNIGVGRYGGTITLPYWCARYAYIWIDDTYTESGLDPNYSRYAYTVQDSVFYNSNNTKARSDDYPPAKMGKIDLAEGLDVDTHVTIGIKQMTFDPTIRFITTSNRIMTGFKVTADDGFGHTSEYDINALSDNVVKTQVFSKAQKLLVSYNGFTVRDGASDEFKRGSGNDKNWVYRIEYTDTDGKAVSKSLSKPSQEPIEIDVDSNGRFPEEIKVSAIPNVKVTLSANGTKQYNRDKSKVFDTVVWQDENGNSDTGSTSTGEYSFWVEQGRDVWIKKLTGSDYIFPYIEEAAPIYKGEDSVLQFTLPKITEDRVFSVSFYEFDLNDKELITVTNGIRNYDGQPGKASVSINGLAGIYAVRTDNDSVSQLYGKNVLGASIYDSDYLKKHMEINIKMDSTESLEYSFDKISYIYYESTCYPESPINLYTHKLNLTEGNADTDYTTDYNAKFKASKDAQGNNIATVYIPTRWILFRLVKDGKFELNVTEYETKRKSSVALSEGVPGTIKTASVKLGGEYRYAINRDGYSTSGTIPYGSDLFLKAEPAEGFKLVSVDIVCPSNSSNNETVTDAKKLAAFASDEGYKYTIKEGVTVIFYTEPVYCATVRYKTGSDELKPKNGKYSIDHKRPVLIQYKKGNTAPSGYNCDIFVGSAMITSNEGISRSSDTYTVDANKGDLAGKDVTFKFYTGDGSKTDSSLQTLTLVFDKADTGVEFGADQYSIPLGSDKEIGVSIAGSFEAKAVLASDKTYDKTGLDFSLDTSKKKLVVKSTADSKPDTYAVNIVNPNDPAVIYGSVKIELETKTVKAAQAPVVQIVGTTNRGVTVGFRAQSIDTTISGLCYELKVITKDQKKNYFRTSRGVETSDKIYVPVTESSIYVDMFTASAASGSQYAGDPDAVFAATARLVQLKADNKTIVIGSDNWSNEKDGTFSTKEGERYETRLRLKKISKGTIYNTMSSGNAYRFGVVYSKKTAIQRLDRTKLELLTESGEEVVYPEGRSMSDYLEIKDDYTVAFHPGGKESIQIEKPRLKLKMLPQGTYIIKVYALEPDSLEVSASVKVKVERGVNGFNTEGISEVIYKQPGKPSNMQVTALGIFEDYLDSESNDVKFAEFEAPKVRYEIVDERNTNGLVKISKGGRITINKKLEPGNTEFKVRIIADDFARNPGTDEIFAEKTIKVRSAYELGDLTLAYDMLYGDPGKYYEEFKLHQGSIHRLENSHYLHELTQFDNELSSETSAKRWQYVPQFWITVYDRNKNDGKSSYVPVDFKISGAGRLVETKNTHYGDSGDGSYGNHGTCARIEITDLDKDIKITAYAKDGSGRKIKSFKLKVKSANGKLGVLISDEMGSQEIAKHNILFWDYGNTNLTFDSYAMEKDGMNMLIGSSISGKLSGVKYKISSVRGGRIAKVRFYYNKIYPTAAKTTFTVTDLTNRKDYNVTINNHGYVDRSKKTGVTVSNRTYDAKSGSKTVNGVIYSHLDFSSITDYTDYDSVLWNTVTFHVDSAEDNQYAMVEVVSSVKRVGGEYKVVTKPIGSCFDSKMKAQSAKEEAQGNDKIERSGIAYPIKLTGKDFTIDFYDRITKKFDMLPGTYKLVITPVRREGYFKYRTLASPATVTLKVVAPPKANIKPVESVAFGISEGTVTKGDYSNFIKSPVYKDQGIRYKELKDVNIDGVLNGFHTNFKITDDRTGKLKYVGTETIGLKDKDRDKKLQGWLILQYQKVDGTVVEEPVKIKIAAKVDIRKK